MPKFLKYINKEPYNTIYFLVSIVKRCLKMSLDQNSIASYTKVLYKDNPILLTNISNFIYNINYNISY